MQATKLVVQVAHNPTFHALHLSLYLFVLLENMHAIRQLSKVLAITIFTVSAGCRWKPTPQCTCSGYDGTACRC
jgi:hypothetical protein